MQIKYHINSLIAINLISILTFPLLFLQCGNDNGNPEVSNSSVPELITSQVSSVTDSSAECGGTITSDGGASVTVRGVCWGTSTNPTISDSKTSDGDGVGVYTSRLTGLQPVTKYYVRAYAINDAGTGYGSTMTFTTLENLSDTMTDTDGNIYKIVKIGSQWWMAENLKVTHYRNGDPIPNVADNREWADLSTGAYCAYNNDDNYIKSYGLLYNWFAVSDSRYIAPAGWHVPTDEEWKQLEMYLGMSQSDAEALSWRGSNEGSKLKAISGWNSNGNGSNESGFTALPGGYRDRHGTFSSVGLLASFWSATQFNSNGAWCRSQSYIHSGISRDYFSIRRGFSVRLVKD